MKIFDDYPTKLEASLQQIERWLQENQPPSTPDIYDSAFDIRIIGEFSSGKTRFLTELIKEHVPEELLPVSSPGRETRIPLAVTFGQEVTLSLINSDEEIPLDRFPDRRRVEELEKLYGVDINTCRLRLTIPQKELLLANDIVAEDTGLARISLLDTPGWSSGELDEELSRTSLASDYTSAVVFICKAGRLSHRHHEEDLKLFIDALEHKADEYYYTQSVDFLIYITEWKNSPENIRALEEFHSRISSLLEARQGAIEYTVYDSTNADFENISKETLQRLRDDFWQRLRASLGLNETGATIIPEKKSHSALEIFNDLPDQDLLADRLERLARLSDHLDKLTHILSPHEEFAPGWNWTRLRAYEPYEWQRVLFDAFNRPLQRPLEMLEQADSLNPTTLRLHQDHPMSLWWNDIILAPVEDLYKRIMGLPNQAKLFLFDHRFDQDQDLQEQLMVYLVDDFEEMKALNELVKFRLNSSIEALISDDGSVLMTLQSLIALTIVQAPLLELELLQKNGKPRQDLSV